MRVSVASQSKNAKQSINSRSLNFRYWPLSDHFLQQILDDFQLPLPARWTSHDNQTLQTIKRNPAVSEPGAAWISLTRRQELV